MFDKEKESLIEARIRLDTSTDIRGYLHGLSMGKPTGTDTNTHESTFPRIPQEYGYEFQKCMEYPRVPVLIAYKLNLLNFYMNVYFICIVYKLQARYSE